MDLELLCAHPFLATAFAWEPAAGEWNLTVLVKATFLLEHGSEATLAAHQEPPSGDVYDRTGSLVYPSDFVPYKPRVDILFSGAAHGAPAALAVGSLDRALEGTTVADLRALPADERARRGDLGAGAQAWAGAVSAIPRGRSFATSKAGPTPSGFDFAFFNAAPRDQQVEIVRPGVKIALGNLVPDVAQFETWLPALRPRVFRFEPEADTAEEVALRCDTIWIDGDDARAVVVWRGLAVGSEVGAGGQACSWGRVVVALERAGERVRPQDASRIAQRILGVSEPASPRVVALPPPVVAPAPALPLGEQPDDDEAVHTPAKPVLPFLGSDEAPRSRLGRTPNLEALPFRPVDAAAASEHPPRLEGLPFRSPEQERGRNGLPFVPTSTSARPITSAPPPPSKSPSKLPFRGQDDDDDRTAAFALPADGVLPPVLPFVRSSSDRPQMPASDPPPATRRRPGWDDDEGTGEIEVDAVQRRATPFATSWKDTPPALPLLDEPHYPEVLREGGRW